MPAAEAPSAAPSTETFSTPANLNDAFSSLDSLFQAEATPTPEPETPEPAPEAPKTAPKATVARPEPKPEVKAPEPKPEAPKAKETPPEPKLDEKAPPQPEKAKTLREAKDRAEAQAKEWQAKYEALEKQAKAPKDDPEKKTLAERLESREKRLAELEQTLKYKAYEESTEYKEKYHDPFVASYQDGREFVSQLEVVERAITNSETGETKVVQPSRQATIKDYDELMALYMKSPAEASKKANQLFGDMAQDVKIKMLEAQKLHKAAESAKEHYRKHGSEIQKQQAEQSQAQLLEAATAWENENKAAQEKYPQWFKPEDGDEKGNALLEKATDMAMRLFDGRADQLPPKERARLHSAIFNKARGFDRLAYKYSTQGKELKAALEKLSQYEQSEPSGGDKRKEASSGEPRAADIDGVLQSLDKLARPLR